MAGGNVRTHAGDLAGVRMKSACRSAEGMRISSALRQLLHRWSSSEPAVSRPLSMTGAHLRGDLLASMGSSGVTLSRFHQFPGLLQREVLHLVLGQRGNHELRG